MANILDFLTPGPKSNRMVLENKTVPLKGTVWVVFQIILYFWEKIKLIVSPIYKIRTITIGRPQL